MIHGSTEIILKSVKSGKEERIKSENTFMANNIAKYLRSLGEYSARTWSTGQTFLWQNIVGGLYLFKDAVPDNSEYMNAGNVMIGNGAYGITNSGTPREFGSYNSVESSTNGHAITQVYDFATHQANGTIGSVCLGSRTGGIIGYGNTSNVVSGNKVSFNNGVEWSNSGGINAGILYNDIEYRFSNLSNRKFTVTKVRRSVGNASVFSGYAVDSITFDISSMNPYNLGTGNYVLMISDCGEGIFRFVPGTGSIYVASGANVSYYEYNANTDELSVGTFTNILNGAIDVRYCTFAPGGFVKVENTAGSGTIHIIDTIHGTQKYVAVTPLPSSDGQGHEIVPGILLLPYNALTSGTVYMYDTVNATLKPCNASTYSQYPTIYNRSHDLLECGITRQSGQSSNWYIRPNPMYLATINNLQTPVVKDATMTMKVIYTLTEE